MGESTDTAIKSAKVEAQRDEILRDMPQSEMDFNMLVIDPKWGIDKIPPSLKARLNEIKLARAKLNKTNENILTYDDLWELLAIYSRDMRLANLEANDEEFCEHYINLSGKLLRKGYARSSILALVYAVTRLELSQSRKGFLRKIFRTFKKEITMEETTPKKRGLITGMEKFNER